MAEVKFYPRRCGLPLCAETRRDGGLACGSGPRYRDRRRGGRRRAHVAGGPVERPGEAGAGLHLRSAGRAEVRWRPIRPRTGEPVVLLGPPRVAPVAARCAGPERLVGPPSQLGRVESREQGNSPARDGQADALTQRAPGCIDSGAVRSSGGYIVPCEYVFVCLNGEVKERLGPLVRSRRKDL
ncbi:hypothetical protein NDU88_009206 [Pleurodeles waltl]|uniref:Uncharacterized protein n=1 Tax=Pleurodeles waltl TaxID=8319 RepID=A0AAV7QV39_PLEWA|nr:hypothetical protein NDU88_009206 [Pleurodeles waltl]